MLSGRNALGSIDQSLHQLQNQVQESVDQIQQTSDSIVSMGQQQTKHFRELAKTRLDSLIAGKVVGGLDVANRRVSELLVMRNAALTDLNFNIQAVERGQDDKERERSGLSERLVQASKALDKREAATQQRLQQQEDYQQQLEKAQQADRIARPAEEKAREAQQSREEKGAVYESDQLFSYLWKSSYGTSDYQTNPLTRFLDKWVANLCDYNDARPNYAMLLEIPIRLNEHAERARKVAEGEFDKLKTLEENALIEDGIPALRDAVEAAQEAVDETDDKIKQMEQEIRGLMEKRAGFLAGEDIQFHQALDTLAIALEKENLDSLFRQARSTPGARDDMLVNELYENDQRLEQLQLTLADYKRNHDKHLDRLAELEKIRRNFKRERYDDIHSGFDNQAILALVLKQFLHGLTNSDDVWNTIRRQQQYNPVGADPTFGSGGIRRGNSTWSNSFPRGGGGRSSGSWGGGLGGAGKKRGGFRTGGGF